MEQKRFAERHGFSPEAPEINIVDDAPNKVRDAILMIAEGELNLSPSTIRGVLCTVLRTLPDGSNWSEYPNVWGECQGLMANAPWYRVYDFIEALYRTLVTSRQYGQAKRWTELIDEYFVEAGVGWRFVDGALERREGDAFVTAVDQARGALDQSGQKTAHDELSEALKDLSRRPTPDLTGAIQHSVAALECTAREATGNPKATLGDILKRYADIVPAPLNTGLEKMWGYSSEFARHLREGRSTSEREVALVVMVSAAVCNYLAGLKPKDRETS